MTEMNMDYQYDDGGHLPTTIPPRSRWIQKPAAASSMPVQPQTRIDPMSLLDTPWTQFTGAALRFQDHPGNQQYHQQQQHVSSSYEIPTTRTSFQDFRGHNYVSYDSYSDCPTKYSETVVTDSGYATGPGLNDLVMGGGRGAATATDPDVRSIAYRLDTVNVAGDPNLPSPSQAQSTPAQTGTLPSEKGTFYCDFCSESVTSKAMLNKHIKRHTKPYKCEVPGCKRKDGFTSETDLNRHKIGFHKMDNLANKKYKCDLGSCKEKDKIWSRRDNFGNHLKNKHGIPPESVDDELERLQCRPEAPARLPMWVRDDGQDLRHVGGQANLQVTITRPSSTGTLAVAQAEEQAEEEQDDDDPESDLQLDCIDNGPTMPQSLHQIKHLSFPPDIDEELISLSRGLPFDPEPVERVASENGDEDMDGDGQASLAEEPLGAPVDNPAPAPPSAAAGKREDLIKMLDSIDPSILEMYLKGKLASREPGTAMDGGESRAEKKLRHPCTHLGCSRAFERQCELNKHLRRHEKPYGCTFPRCDRSFGSKSDWRRHENSQHFQLEMWKCDAKLPTGTSPDTGDVCRRACHRRGVFLEHLQSDHGISDEEELERRQERCRVDRNSRAKFWCGFCELVLTVKGGARDGARGAWSERYDHIADHFTGRLAKMHISEWKGADAEYVELELGPESESPSEEGGVSSAGQNSQHGKRRWIESGPSAGTSETKAAKKARRC